jgi:hypothetical protein
VLGLMERPEPAVADDKLAEPAEPPPSVSPSPTPMERRANWSDRRQHPEDR